MCKEALVKPNECRVKYADGFGTSGLLQTLRSMSRTWVTLVLFLMISFQVGCQSFLWWGPAAPEAPIVLQSTPTAQEIALAIGSSLVDRSNLEKTPASNDSTNSAHCHLAETRRRRSR